MTTVVFAVGTRPNFVKMAPVIEACGRRGLFRQLVVHTGQHYDERMSTEILDDLGFPRPDRFLGIGSGSHGSRPASRSSPSSACSSKSAPSSSS